MNLSFKIGMILFCSVSLFTTACKKEIQGCTNTSSSNYNADATVDDGSCIIKGCTNPDADNYNPDATEDGGDCIIKGCTHIKSDNFNENATDDDGTCIDWADKFVGEFEVTPSCQNPSLLVLNTPFDFNITKVSEDKVQVIFNSDVLGEKSATGTVIENELTGDEINIETLQVGQFTLKNITIQIDMTHEQDANLTGHLEINIGESPLGNLKDNCPLVAIRK